MEPITTSIIIALCTGYLANFSTDVVKHFFAKVIELDPDLESKIKRAKTEQDIEQIFQKAVGVIDAHAGTDSIDVDGGFLEALRGIRFNHAQGTVTIKNVTITAPAIQFGGDTSSAGITTIQNTESKTEGTSIKTTGNAQIKITGNAKITQT